MARRFMVWLGVAVGLVAVLAGVPGCAVPSFQIFFTNPGDYPVVSILVTPETAEDWGPERLGQAVPADGSVLLPAKFARGAVYDVAVVYNTAPETAEGNLVPLTTKVDTSALQGDYVTLWAMLKTDGTNGAGYTYGLPD
ncbi:MAG: hypothetical protein GXY15_03950 [Candidatus Hydrogenedentes bacterium]|nr:hypothetical protein [Candidatus Hydrogenedentota bacterium]